MSDDVMTARAYLSRVAEPACFPLWRAVDRYGPQQVAADIFRGAVPDDLVGPTEARARQIDPHADLEAAARHGMRLVTPESPDWPHVAAAALERAARRRLAEYAAGRTAALPGGERVPPVALWVRGPMDLSSLGMCSVAIVGARASTSYGDGIAATFAYTLARAEYPIVSGGAAGIDARAHQGSLAAGGSTVLVTAGGVDEPYPRSHRRLFDQVAETGAVISESPPGSEPRRHRFLSRNRLIAAMSAGTVVVEAARRSGALNTAAHCRALGRVLMVVPGPVTSRASVGCHALLSDDGPAVLVDDAKAVRELIGGPTLHPESDPDDVAQDSRPELDRLSRLMLEGFPATGSITLDRLAVSCGLGIRDILRTLPGLEDRSLIAKERDGSYRLIRTGRRSTATQPGDRSE